MKYDMQIEFFPVKFPHITDTLSRACSLFISEATDLDEEAVFLIHTLYSNLSATPDKRKEIQEETDKDRSLQLIICHKWMVNKQTKDINKNYKTLAY